LGDKDIGVTFLFGLGALVGRTGFLVKRVVRAGGVGAVHAGVITGLIILSVVFCGVLPLVGPSVTGATVVTLIFLVVDFGISFFVTGDTVVTVFISSLVVSGGGGARVRGRNCVVRLVGSGRLGVSTMGGVYGISGVQAGVISSFR